MLIYGMNKNKRSNKEIIAEKQAEKEKLEKDIAKLKKQENLKGSQSYYKVTARFTDENGRPVDLRTVAACCVDVRVRSLFLTRLIADEK